MNGISRQTFDGDCNKLFFVALPEDKMYLDLCFSTASHRLFTLSILYKCVHAGDAMNMEIVAGANWEKCPGREIFIEISQKYLLKL